MVIDAGAVVENQDAHVLAVTACLKTNDALPGFAESLAVLWRFDPVTGGIAEQMQHRVAQGFKNRLIEQNVADVHFVANFFGQRLPQIANRTARESASMTRGRRRAC